MSAPPAAGNLLFGLLALQTNFITRVQLLDAVVGWLGKPRTPLAQHLSEAGALEDEDKALLARLLNRHVTRHGRNARESLVALGVPQDVFDYLVSLGNAELSDLLADLQPVVAEADPEPPMAIAEEYREDAPGYDPFATIPPGYSVPRPPANAKEFETDPPGGDPFATVPPGAYDPYETVLPPTPHFAPPKKSPPAARSREPEVAPSRGYVPPPPKPIDNPPPQTRDSVPSRTTPPSSATAAGPLPPLPFAAPVPPAPPPPPAPKPVVASPVPVAAPIASPARFRRLRPLERGGMVELYLARDEEFGRDVALKQMPERHADHAGSRDRFLHEAEITARIDHPGVVPVYGKGPADERPSYATRLVQGETMLDAIVRYHEDRRSGPGARTLAMREMLTRFVVVCEAVGHAHDKGVVHRDLKPTNVVLGSFGETLVVNWGQASSPDKPEPNEGPPSSRTRAKDGEGAGVGLGMLAHASPELARGHFDRVGPHSDVFSLGAILYQILTRQPPYPGDKPADVLNLARLGVVVPARRRASGVPPPLNAVCSKAMRPEPNARYDSAKALADDIRCYLADEPVSVYREQFNAVVWRWVRHRPRLTMGAVMVCMATMAALTAYRWLMP